MIYQVDLKKEEVENDEKTSVINACPIGGTAYNTGHDGTRILQQSK